MASDPPKLTFGQPPSTSSSSSPSLFGQPKPAQSSLFGSVPSTQPTPGAPSPFSGSLAFSANGSNASSGATAENKQTGGSTLFGKPASNMSFGSLGGSQTPPKPASSPFGGFGAAASSTPAPPGSSTPAVSGFSFNKPSTTPAGPPPVSLFGGSTGGGATFGNQNKDKPTPSMFQSMAAPGASSSTPATAPGATPAGDQTKQPLSTFTWGKPAGFSQPSNSAPPAIPEPPKSLFGGLGQNAPIKYSSAPATMEAQKSLFSGLSMTNSNAPSSSAPLTSAATPSLFALPSTSSTSSDAQNAIQVASTALATTQSNASDMAKAPSLFGSSLSQTPSTKASSSSAGLFSSLPTTSAAQPSSNLFGPGPAAASTSASASATAPITTASAPSEGLFKIPDKPASSTTAPSTSGPAQPTTSAAVPVTGATAAGVTNTFSLGGSSVLGGGTSSTAGPAPPAQSRLRNKTMDEILTRWASDLTKYTKEFQSHAETVAHWDQLVAENMSKITKLYASTATAEKQTASVEMQLSMVENQQNELESWLSKYEGEVDEMLGKNGAGGGGGPGQGDNDHMEVGGPDQEREETYKLGERLGERLEDMNKDLASMIDEINKANTSLSKTAKPNEPITHIVRILNSHLSQLQAIDHGTATLQAKILAAQQTGRAITTGGGFAATRMNDSMNGGVNGDGMNGRNGNGSGNANGNGGAVEDFYRSYMGRR